MTKIKLDNRLKMVAELVRQGKIVADIGTDHAYLLSFLVQNEMCPSGIAGDVRQGPLDNAISTVEQCGLSEKIECKLSNGLQNIVPNSAEDIVIAGMGGILITEILLGHEWLKNSDINIVVQPMTHAEDVRNYFTQNGFEITKESACADGRRLYCAISASYKGEVEVQTPSFAYVGKLNQNTDEQSKNYLKHQYQRLKKKQAAFEIAKDKQDELAQLNLILEDFEKQVEGIEND
ncbi:MAG: class I SAM-dependent methyltransferase [Clostridia bacterium]